MKEQLFLMRHFWVMFIVFSLVNAFVFQRRFRRHIEERPELAGGYQKILRGYLLLNNLPWLVMGAGIELGGVPTMFSFFRPQDGNPFVLTFFALIFALWMLGFYWLFARRGAEFLVEHPGLIKGNFQNPTRIRIGYCVMVAVGIIGFCYMYVADIPEIIPGGLAGPNVNRRSAIFWFGFTHAIEFLRQTPRFTLRPCAPTLAMFFNHTP